MEGNSRTSYPKDQLLLRVIDACLYVGVLILESNVSEEKSASAAVHVDARTLDRTTSECKFSLHIHVNCVVHYSLRTWPQLRLERSVGAWHAQRSKKRMTYLS